MAEKMQTMSHQCLGPNQYTEQIVFGFMHKKGLVYTSYMPISATGNVDYTVSALRKFLKDLCKKRPDLLLREWVFQSGNAPIPIVEESVGIPS
jgi:hypothetical protein